MDSRFRKACKWSSPLLQLLNKLLRPPPRTITKRKIIIPTRENKPREVEEEVVEVEVVEVEVDAKSKKKAVTPRCFYMCVVQYLGLSFVVVVVVSLQIIMIIWTVHIPNLPLIKSI
jgi:hypothetical protein